MSFFSIDWLGYWNPSNNSPELRDGVGNVGSFYIATEEATVNLGSGELYFNVGYWVLLNSSLVWQAIPITLDGVVGVVSINGDDTPTQEISGVANGPVSVNTEDGISTISMRNATNILTGVCSFPSNGALVVNTGQVSINVDDTTIGINGSNQLFMKLAIGTINSQTKSVNGAVLSEGVLYLQTSDSTYPGLLTSNFYNLLAGATYENIINSLVQRSPDGTIAVGLVMSSTLGNNKALVSNGVNIVESVTTSTEITYVSGVTSSIQTQLMARLIAANNLSDLTSASIARTNLGLGSAAVLNTGMSTGNAAQYSATNSIGDGSTAFLGLANMASQVGNILTVGTGLQFASGSSYNGSTARQISIDSTVVTLTGSQILANKTISGTSNTLSNIDNSSLTNSSITINGNSVALGGSITVSAVTPNPLTVSTGLQLDSGTTFDGSAAKTISIDSTVVTLTGSQTLTNKTISGASNTLSNIGNSSLTNSSITINGNSVSLGGSTTITASTTNSLTISTGLQLDSGTTFNGSAARIISIDSTVVTLTGSQILTNKTISGASNTLSNIGNSSLTNSSITINGNSVALGGSITVSASTTNPLTVSTGLQLNSGTTFDGSVARTISIDNTVVTLTGTQTLTNKTMTGLTLTDGTINMNSPSSPSTFHLDGGIFLSFTGVGVGNCTFTLTGLTALTLPTSGTLATLSNNLGAFAATTSAQLAGVISDETGSGALVFATSPSLTTPILGVASATSINKVAITAPTTSATVTISDGKTFTLSNTLTLTGTDGSSIDFGAGGSVIYQSNPSNTPLDLNGGTFTASTARLSTFLQLLESGASPTFYTQITNGSDLTANRILTIAAGDAARTITLTGNPTLADWFDQSVKQAATPTFAGLTSPSLIGGTTTTSSLTLKTTTGVGTTNADIIFQVGNNGATEAARILNSGNFGIGKTSPQYKLHVQHTANTDGITVQNGTGGASAQTNYYMQTYGDVSGVTRPNAALSAIDGGNFSADMVFYTKAFGADANALTERMRIIKDSAAATANCLQLSYDLVLNTVGKTIRAKRAGTNGIWLTGGVMVAGVIAFNTTAVSTGDLVFPMKTANGGTSTVGMPAITIVNGTSVTLTSSIGDTSTWDIFIIKQS